MNVTITGGAGFVGVNLARHFLEKNDHVTVFDSCSRIGSRNNLNWLREHFNCGMKFVDGDIRNFDDVRPAVADADAVLHLAAQVAVTTSVIDPVNDFQVNAQGTLNVLEAIRRDNPRAALIYTSTNKVYGGLTDLPVTERALRYEVPNAPDGIDESRPLDFHSPYGCSKGAADQYVQDYARIYDLKTVTFRMSCIYGPFQNGNEDQGWVVHFARVFANGGNLNIYGDGKQVRDILYVSDLVSAFELALANIGKTAGRVYNIGGGVANSVSLLELNQMLRERTSGVHVLFHGWRPGDQRWYVSNTERAQHEFGWAPKVDVNAGVDDLLNWVRNRRMS